MWAYYSGLNVYYLMSFEINTIQHQHSWNQIPFPITIMVTAVTKKMNRNSSTTTTTTTTTIIAKKILEASVSGSISSASGFRLLIEANGGLSNRYSGSGSGGRSSGLDQCETMSTVSKCSVYKQRIDAMFDDSK